MRRIFYEYTNARKVFHNCYVMGAIGCVFCLVSGLNVRYTNPALNIAKWKGLILGCIAEIVAIVITYFLVRLVATAVGVIFFIAYIGHVIFVGVYFSEKMIKKRETKRAMELQSEYENQHEHYLDKKIFLMPKEQSHDNDKDEQ